MGLLKFVFNYAFTSKKYIKRFLNDVEIVNSTLYTLYMKDNNKNIQHNFLNEKLAQIFTNWQIFTESNRLNNAYLMNKSEKIALEKKGVPISNAKFFNVILSNIKSTGNVLYVGNLKRLDDQFENSSVEEVAAELISYIIDICNNNKYNYTTWDKSDDVNKFIWLSSYLSRFQDGIKFMQMDIKPLDSITYYEFYLLLISKIKEIHI